MRSAYFSKAFVGVLSALFFIMPLSFVHAGFWCNVGALINVCDPSAPQSSPSGQGNLPSGTAVPTPPPVYSQNQPPTGVPSNSGYNLIPQNPPQRSSSGQFLINPLKYEKIDQVVIALLGVVSYLGFFIAIFFVIYSGFLFVTAQGNEEKITEARNNFKWTIIGVAILLGAQALAYIVEATVNQITR